MGQLARFCGEADPNVTVLPKQEEDKRAEFVEFVDRSLFASHGIGLRLAAILLRRITMIETITTNMTPAMIRTVIGSMESLSLKNLRHQP